jgi:hypothetical protein
LVSLGRIGRICGRRLDAQFFWRALSFCHLLARVAVGPCFTNFFHFNISFADLVDDKASISLDRTVCYCLRYLSVTYKSISCIMAFATTRWQSAKDEVSSWIENEQACVTAQRIAQTMELSRSEASLLLKEIIEEKGNECQITTCRRVQKEGVTGESYKSSRTPRF